MKPGSITRAKQVPNGIETRNVNFEEPLIGTASRFEFRSDPTKENGII